MKKYFTFLMSVAILMFSCGKDYEKPTVSTIDVVDITSASAKVNAKVEDDGGTEVTMRGICWNTEQNPTIENFKTTDGEGLGMFTSNLSSLTSQTTYYVRAYATNSEGTSYGEEKSFVTLEEEVDVNAINGYEYVDLGLPSGLKWATCNVGASAPDQVGDYFAWGELVTKERYSADNSVTYGAPMGDISADIQYDVATYLWESTWRIPTEAETRELKDNCTWEWIMQDNGVWGSVATGPNGNQVFFPSGGFKTETNIDFADSEAAYWTSTPDNNENDPGYATFFYVYNNNFCNLGWFSRYAGLLVRPVSY